ncbi:hypothetical protein SO802_008197 [Lithocarpus litseifolius]|uniref:Chaperone DnaJ C-terminal domain-containing protein n=1 Tax=Lithocarpus litseifolius TaxID=425828 RepID=A0AAW2DBP9_9ROSI
MDVCASAVDGLEVVEDELVFELYGHIFEDFFGRRLGGEDVKVGVVLPLDSNRKNVLAITCPQCHGEREIVPPKYICKSCKGRRIVLGTKSVKLPGVDQDETIKVSRSGGADPDGNQPGDLYIVIMVREDPVFRREGAVIHVDAILSITQAILEGTI